MGKAPDVETSTKEERQSFIRSTYQCIADCDACGICQVFRGTDPQIVFEEYIQGKKTYQEICDNYR